VDLDILYGERDIFSEAKVVTGPEGRYRFFWTGNFFPDVASWEKLESLQSRGAGGTAVVFQSVYGGPAATQATMSVFPGLRYKKGHRHGPGYIIVMPKGEGYSFMWQQGSDEVIYCPWHEASLMVPPNQWWHQHFNLGGETARYLKISGHIPATNINGGASIEYSDEDPAIRREFEGQLRERGLTSAMPEECYLDPDYQWPYGEDMSGD
jgi:gentisate 1,2-dioxygenase